MTFDPQPRQISINCMCKIHNTQNQIYSHTYTYIYDRVHLFVLHRSQGPKQFLQNNIWRETVFVSDSKELQDAAAEAALEWREKA